MKLKNLIYFLVFLTLFNFCTKQETEMTFTQISKKSQVDTTIFNSDTLKFSPTPSNILSQTQIISQSSSLDVSNPLGEGQYYTLIPDSDYTGTDTIIFVTKTNQTGDNVSIKTADATNVVRIDTTYLIIKTIADGINNQIIGKWFWIETYYNTKGRAPLTDNFENQGFKLEVEFDSNNIIKIFKNNELKASYKYVVQKMDLSESYIIFFSDYPEDISKELLIDDGPIQIIEKKLIISGGYDDSGGNWLFVKKA